MFMGDREKEDVRRAVALGRQWGHGNLIDRLKIAWALDLHVTDKLPLSTAFRAARLDPERAEGPGTDEQKVEWMRRYIGDVGT